MKRRVALALEFGALALILLIETFVYVHGLPAAADFDESVYLAAVDAFRHGQELGSPIFTAQPPGFYWLLTAGDEVFGNSLGGVRDFVLLLALFAAIGAYLTGRALAGRGAGLAAAALLAISPPFAGFATKISADLPSMTVGLLALGAFVYCLPPRSRPWLAAVSGILLAYAVSVKLTALVLLVPIAGVACVRKLHRRELLLFASAFLGALGAIVLASVGRLHALWHDVVSYHSAARRVPDPSSNASAVAGYFTWRSPLTWLLAAAALGLAIGIVKRSRAVVAIWSFPVVAVGALLWQRPLHDNHGVLLAVALVLPVACVFGLAVRQPRSRVAVAAIALLALGVGAGYAKEWRRAGRNTSREPAEIRWAVAQVDLRTNPGELVASDQPIVPFFAHRQNPGELVDTAVLRFQSGYLTPAMVAEVLRRRHIRLVVAMRAFAVVPGMEAALRSTYPARIRHGAVTIYFKPAAH